MKGFSAFCDKYNITHIHKRALSYYPFNKATMEFDLSKEMLEIVYARLSGTKKAILDIHLLGGEVRVSIAFCDDGWHYGFGIGHKFATPDKCIKMDKKETQDLQAIEIIAKEMREFALNYIKRKPYILFKPSVIKAIKLW